MEAMSTPAADRPQVDEQRAPWPPPPFLSDQWVAYRELRLGEWLLTMRPIRWLAATAGLLGRSGQKP